LVSVLVATFSALIGLKGAIALILTIKRKTRFKHNIFDALKLVSQNFFSKTDRGHLEELLFVNFCYKNQILA